VLAVRARFTRSCGKCPSLVRAYSRVHGQKPQMWVLGVDGQWQSGCALHRRLQHDARLQEGHQGGCCCGRSGGVGVQEPLHRHRRPLVHFTTTQGLGSFVQAQVVGLHARCDGGELQPIRRDGRLAGSQQGHGS